MDKLKMHSTDLIEANIARLAELFPNCVTEARAGCGRRRQCSGGGVTANSAPLRPSRPGRHEHDEEMGS